MAGTASGARRSVCWGCSGCSEDSEEEELDSETELGSEVVVCGYNLYTSSRDSLASGTIKS